MDERPMTRMTARLPVRAPTKSATPGRRPLKRLKRHERYDSILKAARSAFTETGDIGLTSIRKIAATAGINEALIYAHFSNKDELIAAAIMDPLEDALRIMDVTLYSNAPKDLNAWASSGREYLRQIVEVMSEIGPLLGLVIFGEKTRARRFYNRVLLPNRERIKRQAQNHFGPDFPHDAFLLSMWGTAMFVAMEGTLNSDKPDIEKLVEDVLSIMTKGFYHLLSTKVPAARRKPALKPARNRLGR